LKINTKIKY